MIYDAGEDWEERVAEVCYLSVTAGESLLWAPDSFSSLAGRLDVLFVPVSSNVGSVGVSLVPVTRVVLMSSAARAQRSSAVCPESDTRCDSAVTTPARQFVISKVPLPVLAG